MANGEERTDTVNAKGRWEKADISYHNYLKYIQRKGDKYALSLIDLLYVSNFKGGNASINESESSVNQKLERYSSLMREIQEEFGERRLAELTREDIVRLKEQAGAFLNLTARDSSHSIDGFKSSYASALLHFHFPNLIPILDRRVLNGAGLEVEVNSQKQVVRIERYFPELIDKFYEELRKRQNLTLRALDKEYFTKKIGKGDSNGR